MVSALRSKFSICMYILLFLLTVIYHNSDCRKLQRDFPTVDSQRMIDQCKDLGVWCNFVMRTSGRWSMERLVMHIVSRRILYNFSVQSAPNRGTAKRITFKRSPNTMHFAKLVLKIWIGN